MESSERQSDKKGFEDGRGPSGEVQGFLHPVYFPQGVVEAFDRNGNKVDLTFDEVQAARLVGTYSQEALQVVQPSLDVSSSEDFVAKALRSARELVRKGISRIVFTDPSFVVEL